MGGCTNLLSDHVKDISVDSSSTSPTVYWVVGSGTNVGKTTIAATLITALNAAGTRTAGFKPFAGGRLQGLIDFMLAHYPGASSGLFGQDGLALTEASPLTDESLVDLVAPVQMLSYPTWRNIVLMRTGSGVLNNVDYLCSAQGAQLRHRPDIKDLIARTGLPFAEAAVKPALEPELGAPATGDKQAQAFRKLCDMGAEAVVCEGAGGWLPVWPDCPAVNHLVYVADGTVTLFPALDRHLPFDPKNVLRNASELHGMLNHPGRQKFSNPLYLVESDRRAAMALQIIQSLLARTGLVESATPSDGQ